MLIGATLICRLFLRPRLWGFRKMKAGVFGPIVKRRDGAFCVELSKVETAMGVTFTAEQLAAAVIFITLSGKSADG